MTDMAASRSAPVTPRPSATTETTPSAASVDLNRLAGARAPSRWGNPKLAYGGGLVVLVALVALGVTRVDFDAAPASDPIAQPPVDVTPAPDDAPAPASPTVTALPSDPIGSDRTPGSPGSVEPVAPAGSALAATANCDAAGVCAVTASFSLNVSAATLEVVVGTPGGEVAARHPIDEPGRAGAREAQFTLPSGSARCFWVEATDAAGRKGAPSNALCVDASGAVGPAPAGQ